MAMHGPNLYPDKIIMKSGSAIETQDGTDIVAVSGNAATISGTETISSSEIADNAITTSKLNDSAVTSGKIASSVLKVDTVTISNAEMLALRASPKTLVAAPGSNNYIEFISAALFFDRTAGYTETADNMLIRFENGSGTAVSEAIEATGFVDAASDAVMPVKPATSAVVLSSASVNKALVLHNTGDGEYGGGNASNEVLVTITYRVHATGF